jgi:hypothetical protein
MAMEYEMVKISEPPMARLLLKVNEAEGICSRRFVERHRGSFAALRSPKDGDRLDIPAGARVERTEGRQDAQARPRLWPVRLARLVIFRE